MKLTFTRRARAELRDVERFIGQDNPNAAAEILDRIDRIILQIAAGELQGPEARLLDGRRVQSWPVPPYRVYYRRTATETLIVRVYHQARRPIER